MFLLKKYSLFHIFFFLANQSVHDSDEDCSNQQDKFEIIKSILIKTKYLKNNKLVNMKNIKYLYI